MSLFCSTFAGHESGANSGQGGVSQCADNDKPACFRLAGFSDAEKILALIDGLLSRETHGSGVPERWQCGRIPRRIGAGGHPRSKLSTVLRDMTLEVKLCAFRNQAFTAFLTTAFDAITSSLGGHAGAETVLLFTGTFGGLVSAKAHGRFFSEWLALLKARGRDFRRMNAVVNAAVGTFLKNLRLVGGSWAWLPVFTRWLLHKTRSHWFTTMIRR